MTDDQPLPLSREEARLLAEQLAVLANAGLPLASGLRAAAEEIPSPRLKTAMTGVAERLERGRSLDDVLRGSPRLMPEHMLRLVETGIRSGNLPAVLTHLVEIDRSWFDLRRSVRMAIAYPLLLMVLCSMLVIFVAICILPDLKTIMSDFDTALPWATRALFWFTGKKVLAIFGVGIAAITMMVVLTRISLPPQQWRWLQTRIPIFGPIILWRGIANWARLVSLLLKQNLPAPEALRLAALGVNDALMAVEGLRLARTANYGRSVSDSLKIVGRLPASIVPLVRWGEEHNSLPQAFDSIAEMFENRLRLRTALIQSALPPLAFICVALLVLWLVNAMFMPLAELLESLYWWKRRPAPPAWLDFLSDHAKYFVAAAFVLVGTLIFIWPAARVIFVSTAYTGRGKLERYSSGISQMFFATLKYIGLFVLYLGMLAGMIFLCGYTGPVIWLATMFVFQTLELHYAETERRSLLQAIAIAAEKGIPLANTVYAFALNRRDKLGKRARRLAEQLSKGVSLDEALVIARIRLPTDALLAVRTANVTKSVTTLVSSSARKANILDVTLQKAASKFFYLTTFAIFAVAAIAFIQMSIVPAFIKILADFRIKQPAGFGFIFGTRLPFVLSPISILALFALLFMVGMLAFVAARYSGLLRWDPPLARGITLPLDEALVLRSLADAVEQNTPLYVMVAALARKYPKNYIRDRLDVASNQISNGVDWCESLHSSGLLPSAEASVLKAAERVGNLAWAMNDMAERLSRRFVMRVTAIMAIGFPVVLVLFAAVVSLVAFGLIEPLAELVARLAMR